MDAQEILAALDAAGIEVLIEPDGRVALSKPPTALPEEVIAAIKADPDALRTAYLERQWLRYLATRPLRTDDPRPDIAGDSTLWSLLLNRVDGMGNTALREALHCLRCLGARLVRVDGALRLVRGDELSAEEYAAYREDWLVPHVRDLTEALTQLDAQARQIERRRRVAA
jgi:hypothetical protein